jgi:hypothetical protein
MSDGGVCSSDYSDGGEWWGWRDEVLQYRLVMVVYAAVIIVMVVNGGGGGMRYYNTDE